MLTGQVSFSFMHLEPLSFLSTYLNPCLQNRHLPSPSHEEHGDGQLRQAVELGSIYYPFLQSAFMQTLFCREKY